MEFTSDDNFYHHDIHIELQKTRKMNDKLNKENIKYLDKIHKLKNDLREFKGT